MHACYQPVSQKAMPPHTRPHWYPWLGIALKWLVDTAGWQRFVISDIEVRSDRLPGGDLIAAVLNRQLMAFADRGGSSGLVGQRWSDHCDNDIQGWIGGLSDIPGGRRPPIVIDRIARLDAVPAIAHTASKRGLQNPDFIIIGTQDGRPAMQATDAKFSVETARSRQVSAEVLSALLGIGEVLVQATGAIDPETIIEPGFFLSPDYSLTHHMMRRRHGIMRVSVREDEVEQLAVDPATFFTPLPGATLMPLLAGVDDIPIAPDQSLLAGLYYFRIARAVIGFWIDSVKPLLMMGDKIEVDVGAVEAEMRRRVDAAGSAYRLMLDWDVDVERTRANRAAVDQVTSLPILNRDLRELIARLSDDLGIEAPSMNQVRRRLGAWFRGELRNRVGPLDPPVPNLPAVLRELAAIGAELAPRVPRETERIVLELGVQHDEAAADEASSEPVEIAAPN
jgi:hypothetical protein